VTVTDEEDDGRCPECGEDELDGGRCYYCGWHSYDCGDQDCKWCAIRAEKDKQ
jgi:hypothetical protein